MIVIGGHTRNIGKTSVVSGLIESLRSYPWTAVKITQFGHGICSVNGRDCNCAVNDHPFAIQEEKSLAGESDTSRFLVAGARRSLWVRVKQGQLDLVMPRLLPVIESDPFVIVESNSILKFVKPELYIFVMRYDVSDFKESARNFMSEADAAVVVPSSVDGPSWEDIPARAVGDLPHFHADPPCYVAPELSQFVESRLPAVP